MEERDRPYSPDEERVSDYLQELVNGQAGSGPDPIGFLMASHAALKPMMYQRAIDWLSMQPHIGKMSMPEIKGRDSVKMLAFMFGKTADEVGHDVSDAWWARFRETQPLDTPPS